MSIDRNIGFNQFSFSGSNETGSFNVDKIIDQIKDIQGVSLPKNKVELRILKSHLLNASIEKPLDIYVGSCPDYSHQNGLYTHSSLGEEISLLTSQHLKYDKELLKTFDANNIPYKFIVMIADVEATDEIFASKFTGNSVQEFMRRCEESRKKTEQELMRLKFSEGIKGELVSSSFFGEFTYAKFIEYQNNYSILLNNNYASNSNFKMRIDGDTASRMGMYTRMYEGVTDNMKMLDKHGFYVSRTIRTMAQYLSLGRLISEKSAFPIVINHPTRNISVFNDRNKYLLPGDGSIPQTTIPVFEMTTKVY